MDVVNAHWFGGVDKLPENTVYVGRPSPYGNPFSSADGKMSRFEAIARHRVDLYCKLCSKERSIDTLRHDLGGHDLACWCKLKNRNVGCHADSYVHVLSPVNENRDYSRSVMQYIVDDFNQAIKSVRDLVRVSLPIENYLTAMFLVGEFELEFRDFLAVIKNRKDSSAYSADSFMVIVILLELAARESSMIWFEYYIKYAVWESHRYINQYTGKDGEPVAPNNPVKRRITKK